MRTAGLKRVESRTAPIVSAGPLHDKNNRQKTRFESESSAITDDQAIRWEQDCHHMNGLAVISWVTRNDLLQDPYRA